MNTFSEQIGEEYITKVLQKKERAMLKEVKEIFQKHNIPFFLACGTALGCARHKGFIPWDDDVDIYVMGTDLPRIKDAFEQEKSSFLKFQDYTKENKYPYWFPKIVASDTLLVEKAFANLGYSCGVYIDIFPLFFASDNFIVRMILEKIRYFRYALLRVFFNESFNIGCKRIIKFFVKKIVDPRKIQIKLEKSYLKQRKRGRYLIDSGTFHKNALIKASSFENSVEMEFEKMSMPMPKGYKEYLTDYYGDYMQLPPPQDRISRHHFIKLEIPMEDRSNA